MARSQAAVATWAFLNRLQSSFNCRQDLRAQFRELTDGDWGGELGDGGTAAGSRTVVPPAVSHFWGCTTEFPR